jgi:PAS domain-containing protein
MSGRRIVVGGCAAICIAATVLGLYLTFNAPSARAFGYSLAQHVGGSTSDTLSCYLPREGVSDCQAWDAQQSGQERYRITRESRRCWRAEEVPGGIPETPMRERASACVTLGERIAPLQVPILVCAVLAFVAVIFFGSIWQVLQKYGGLGQRMSGGRETAK